MTELKHWSLMRDDDDIAWLSLDKQDSLFNTLSNEVLTELEHHVDHLYQQPPRGMVIQSGKPTGFVNGLDIDEFSQLLTESDALNSIQYVQSLFNKIDNLPFPSVALINGPCLDSGLELALACQYRIADNGQNTRLGFTEASLGLHPAFGGCTRLFKLVNPLTAFDLLLECHELAGDKAKEIGLIDYAVPERHLINAARQTILTPPRQGSCNLLGKLLNHRVVRPWLSKIVHKNITRKVARIHYPAPYAVLELWQHYNDNSEQMMQEEAQSAARLVIGKTTQNLIHTHRLKALLSAPYANTENPISHIHVVGGGVMGGDIAAWCAMQGLEVTIQDTTHKVLANVVKRANDLYLKTLVQPRLVKAALDRLTPDIRGYGLTRADIIIETVNEEIEIKHDVLKEIESKIKPDAVIATNTSSISLASLSSVLKKPKRLIGLHFFNPVVKMPLVEIIINNNSQDIIDTTRYLLQHIGKLPLPVKNSPGFLVNRVLMPYMIEAMMLAEEGVPYTMIDQAAIDFGMQMGPIELADTVGLDLCLHVAENLSSHLGINIPGILKKKVKKGKLGKKTGQGFYRFKNGQAKKKTLAKNYTVPIDIQDRLIMRLLNETVACLREEITTNADFIDAGLIFGAGFAPFRGGPIHYIESRGAEQLVRLLESLTQRYGARFEADNGWQQLISK